MLSNTWSTYKSTFERQRSGYLQELVTRNATSRVAIISLDTATEFEDVKEKEGMAERYITDSASSSTTLVPHKEEIASSDAVFRTDLSDSVGTVLPGIQLSALSREDLANLASLVTARGVLFFENQDGFDKSALNRIVALFDPADDSTNPKDDIGRKGLSEQTAPLQAQDQWHTDASNESSPPSISLLQIEGESEDVCVTAFVSQYGVYDSLSKPLQSFLDGLTAVHSSGQRSAEHPAVRSHPVSGLKALNVTPQNVQRFPELNKKESDKLLELLEFQIHSSAEHTIQWKWKPGDIALWDNRCVAYRHISNAPTIEQRSTKHTFLHEKPYLEPTSESRVSRTSRLAAEEQSERERVAQIKARYNNTPLRRILARQLSKEVTPIRIPSATEPQHGTPSPADTVIALQDASEPESIAQIKARFNNTPLRRILARQTSRDASPIDSSPTLKETKVIVSPVDSVMSEQDAEELAQSTVSEHRQKRMEEWASGIDDGLQVQKTRSVPVKRSNTPLRRILERQVSASLERRLQWS
ncbi:TauD-domain-containing protein [Paraphaeosphaeria sporulosa]|uniref:TauD-domain-containing protein n=1 Tax=Paraphaeosphaeria sporulosa TaxID=1460663 RepID=A0A177C039_9PLEO|nr:TauD-domain-containing protein [Paraphaeosphaeria sporulosa]OAG01003.1 TauD-domain-containing protein [Paraphaeosphaeria sporulosa]